MTELSLGSEWYADPAIFRREQTNVLQKSWHYAAHSGQFAGAGSRVLVEVGGVPVVLVQDASGTIRGFLNICRHRGHPVALDELASPTLQCAYHGWSYDLDGRLRAAPRSEHEDEFETDVCLVDVQVAVWGPTVWANVDADAEPFDAWIDGLPEMASAHGLDLGMNTYAFEKRWKIAANWKLFQENAIECYHCPTCHPELSRVIDTNREVQELVVGGRNWVYTRIPLRESGVDYHFFWIFPTTYFQYIVGRGFDIGTVRPVSVNEIDFTHVSFLPVHMDDETRQRRHREMDADPTVDQDVALMERVQISHETGLAPPGRFLMHSEFQLKHFQLVLQEMCGDLP